MNELYAYKSIILPASFKDVDGKKGIVTGYFASFDNVDADGDIIRKGAFTRSINNNGPKSAQPRIKHLMNHDISKPLGRLTDLHEDNKGLVYESQIGTHSLGQDFVKMVESGMITEHSIGYKTEKQKAIQSFADYKKNPTKGLNEILSVKMYEGSSLSGVWGVNPMTPITGIKADINYLVEKQKALEAFCRNTDATDETIEMLLLHTKQLSQIILDLQKTTGPADDATLPVKEIGNVLTSFKKSLQTN